MKQIIDLVGEGALKEYLRKQLVGYEEFQQKARKMLNAQTMMDRGEDHIAKMLITGSNMGIVEAVQNRKRYENAEKEILKLMEQLQHFEEKNVEELKKFL